MKLLIISLAFVTLMTAQTVISPTQTASQPDPAARLLLYLPSGLPSLVYLDPATLVLDTTTTPPTLKAIPLVVKQNVWVRESIQISGTNKIQVLGHTPTSGSLFAYRNGLLQQEGMDYTLAGLTMTWVFVVPGDKLTAAYQYTP